MKLSTFSDDHAEPRLLRQALPLFFVLAGAALLLATTVGAAVSLTVSPSLITNDFVGKVTLTIAGLSAGASVRVEKIADLNTNGVADAGEPVFRSLIVTDGQKPVLCGLANLNVAGDTDGAANGQIKTVLYFPGADNALDRATGQFIYKISNPTDGTQLAAQTFAVVPQRRSQGVRGRITAGGAPLSNAVVALIRPKTPETLIGATDASGNYAFYTDPAVYGVAGALKSGFVSDATSGFVTVAANQFVTNNFAMVSAGFTLSGKVSDLSSGIGISGITVVAQSTNNLLFSIGITDTNGNYNLPVTPTQWRVRPDEAQLAAAGYLSLPNRTKVNVSGSVANINFQSPKADALIYGTVSDDAGNPVLGLDCNAQQGSSGQGQYEALGRSYVPDGAYALGVKTGTNWQVGIFNDALWINGFVARPSVNVDLASGCSARVDLVVTRMNLAQPARASSTGFQFQLNGVNQQNYTILASSNLVDWVSLFTTNAPSDSFVVIDPAATGARRFYRAAAGP